MKAAERTHKKKIESSDFSCSPVSPHRFPSPIPQLIPHRISAQPTMPVVFTESLTVQYTETPVYSEINKAAMPQWRTSYCNFQVCSQPELGGTVADQTRGDAVHFHHLEHFVLRSNNIPVKHSATEARSCAENKLLQK